MNCKGLDSVKLTQLNCVKIYCNPIALLHYLMTILRRLTLQPGKGLVIGVLIRPAL